MDYLEHFEEGTTYKDSQESQKREIDVSPFPQSTTREEFLKWRQDLIDYKPEKK